MANSFFHPLGELNFDKYKTKDVAEALETFLQSSAKNDEAILKLKPNEITFENSALALCSATDELDFLGSVVGHLAGTIGGDWNDKEQLVSEKTTKFYTDRSLDKKLYDQMVIAQKLPGLDKFEQRLIDEIVRDYKRGGIDLPEVKKTELKKLRAELSKLSTDFGQNAVKANDEAFLLIANKGELEGVSEAEIKEWANVAKKEGKQGYYIQFSAPNFDQIMTHCSVQKTRQAMHKISRMRAPQNEPIAKKMLDLRHKIAQLLGHKNYVDYALEERMAKTGKAATDFIKMLSEKYDRPMHNEAKALDDFIKSKGGDKLDITDVDGGTNFYYASKMFAETVGLDTAKLQEYFVMDNVLQGMFDCLEKLYEVKFKKNESIKKWHPDVQVFDVYNKKNEHISRIWGDWYARKGKQAGAWQHAIHFADRSNGVKAPHLNAVCTNFSPPSKTKPSLLTMRDIETLWHEFGHAMHCTFSSTKLKPQNTYGCKWDFIEAPSQIMENWVWQKQVLGMIAKHYKTGEALPEQILDKLLQSRIFRAASAATWTIGWSAIDLELHANFDQKDSLSKTYRKIKQKYCPVAIPEYDNNICTFTHIFAGGYAAGYYGYKWAEAIEADLFSKFLENGILNPAVGQEYREKVLARGDEVDPNVLVKDFLGRDTTPKALLQRDGLA